MAKNVDIRILANTGTDALPVYTVVGGQRNATLTETAETIDTTSADSNGDQEFDYGLSTWTVSCDGLYVPTDSAYVALKTAIRDKKKVLVQISEDGAAVDQGTALVTSRSVTGTYNAESTYSIELQGSGALGAAV